MQLKFMWGASLLARNGANYSSARDDQSEEHKLPSRTEAPQQKSSKNITKIEKYMQASA